MNYLRILLIITFSTSWNIVCSQSIASCKAILKNDTLRIENEYIRRDFQWNKGDLISLSLADKKRKQVWPWKSREPDCAFPGHKIAEEQGQLEIIKVIGQPNQADHLEITVIAKLGSLEVKRIFQLYPGSPTLTCNFYLRGIASDVWKQSEQAGASTGNTKNIESSKELNRQTASSPRMERLSLQGNHFKLRSVIFSDVTDRNNTLINETEHNLFGQPGYLKGNLLLIRELPTSSSFFLLKESPVSSIQLANPGFDFFVKTENIQVSGLGITPSDLQEKTWLRGYGFTIGLGGTTELETLQALRTYQDLKRPRQTKRDDMILMNTWGDRNQDKKISESFTIAEIKKAALLGITHFQLDDGWQTGKSGNSAFKGGSFVGMHRNPDYWKPDADRFPNGLDPIVEAAKNQGIELALWFNPSGDSSFINWKKDAGALIYLYRQYGIRTFKIDGVSIENKVAEVNFRSMLDSVLRATDYKAVFNMDVTAGRRNGYFYFNEYGNIFLENRYTDWTNYYPYWTLWNFWKLAWYVPAQNLQIEFLNKWRNQEKYPTGDPYAPNNYDFDYLFAITMMAQPLAWFEATGLPEQAFSVNKLIKTYRQFQANIHAGQIFPIGKEPNGSEWTGFQSILTPENGFILVFREASPQKTKSVSTWLKKGDRIELKFIAGSGKSYTTDVAEDGKIKFDLPKDNSFALYLYRRISKYPKTK